ncbi:MAG: hypothetical protein FD177_1021 [Desulfovibrionaceae bacterium]|nr:MAG: hypothetical protein FD177_1021 [Desulfovibrionaceae bacterium]
MPWTHDALAEDLALSLGLLPYLNVVLGSPWMASRHEQPPRADVLGVKPSYTKFCVSIYEVKVSRADFLSDVRSEKWRSYLPHCHRLYFATLPDVCTRADIPAEAGWMVRTENSWTTRKASQSRDTAIPEQTLQALVFARQRPGIRGHRLDDIRQMLKGNATDWYTGRPKAARVFGREVSRLIARVAEMGGRGGVMRGLEMAMKRLESAHLRDRA